MMLDIRLFVDALVYYLEGVMGYLGRLADSLGRYYNNM